MKGLPFAYNRDLQEDKEPVFDSIETLLVILPALTGMVSTAIFHPSVIGSGVLAGHSLATEVADFLAKAGVPFAQAHEAAGECVKLCEKEGKELHQLSDSQFASVHEKLTPDIRTALSAQGAIDSRSSILGTAVSSVAEQISNLESATQEAVKWISNERHRFSGMMKP